MQVKQETIAFDKDATIDDLFQAFADRALEGMPPREYKIVKNAFYMGINATLSMLNNAESKQDFNDRFENIESAFETYNANLVGRH